MRRFVSALRSTMVLSVVALAAACAAEEDAPQEESAPAAEPAALEPAAAREMPDTTAEAVWAYLEARDYQSWPLWPGTSELYTGVEPHGMLLTTYANGVAMESLEAGAPGDIASGGIVVKENYMPDGTLAAVTVMYKVEGYNPEHQDWWFLKRLADGTVEASGRVAGCQGCHIAAPRGDYLFNALPGDEAAAGEESGG
jgi:hypothetical protein